MVDVQYPSKTAIVFLDAAAIGTLKGFEHGVETKVLKDHDLAGGAPTLLEPVEQSFTWSAEVGWIDNTWAAKILAGTKFTLKFRPKGTGQALPECVYGNCVLTSVRDKAGKVATLLTGLEGEALTRVDGVQA